MADGRIIEVGCHDQLMGRDGHYDPYYNSYRCYQSLEYIEAKSWRLELGDVAAD